MGFWKKSESDDQEIDTSSLFDGDDTFYETQPTPVRERPSISPEVLDVLEDFRSDLELIREGQAPKWKAFFENMRTLEQAWPDLIAGDSDVSCPCFADEIMDEENCTDQEWLFTDTTFLNGILEFIDGEVHFACWLLTSRHRNLLKSAYIKKLYEAIQDSEQGNDCEECGQNFWWGSPLVYVAENKQTPASLLEELYEDALDIESDEILAALAQNPKTPSSILSELESMDRVVSNLEDETCPFYIDGDEDSINIAKLAIRNKEIGRSS